MNNQKIIKMANIVGIVSIALLVYWVFAFILITVFGLKVFKENMTETFYLSVMGILALMAGSLIISVMFNMSTIAEALNKNNEKLEEKATKIKWKPMLVGLFFLITMGLFAGDYLTTLKKKDMLIQTAEQITENYSSKLNYLTDYTFTEAYAQEAETFVKVILKSEKNFEYVSIIIIDQINGIDCFLEFRSYSYNRDSFSKDDFIFSGDRVKKEYLNEVFKGNNLNYYFSSHDGRYELFYPFKHNEKIIVLFFRDYQSHGKIGS